MIRAAVGLATRGSAPGLAAAVPGAIVPVLLAALSARLFRRRGLAIATGALAAVLPQWLAQSGVRPSLSLALLLVSAFLLVVAADRPSSNFAVLSGVSLGLAGLANPAALVLAPFLAAPLFDRRYPRRVDAHVAGSALLGLVLVLTPAVAGRPGSWPSLRPDPDPSPGAPIAVLTALLFALAAVGLARARRRGSAWFCIGIVAATAIVPVVWGRGASSREAWVPILLLYGTYGAASLMTRTRHLETEAA